MKIFNNEIHKKLYFRRLPFLTVYFVLILLGVKIYNSTKSSLAIYGLLVLNLILLVAPNMTMKKYLFEISSSEEGFKFMWYTSNLRKSFGTYKISKLSTFKIKKSPNLYKDKILTIEDDQVSHKFILINTDIYNEILALENQLKNHPQFPKSGSNTVL